MSRTVYDLISQCRSRLTSLAVEGAERAKVSIYGPVARQDEAVALGALLTLNVHTDAGGGTCVACDRSWPCADVLAVLTTYLP